MEKAESLNHHKFFKYMKPKFISAIEKMSVDLCNICNGDLAKLKRRISRFGRDNCQYN